MHSKLTKKLKLESKELSTETRELMRLPSSELRAKKLKTLRSPMIPKLRMKLSTAEESLKLRSAMTDGGNRPSQNILFM